MNDKDKKNKQDGNNWDWINQILWSPYGYFKRLFGLEDKKKPIQEEELKTTWPMTKMVKKKIAEKKQKLASKRKKPVKKTVIAPVNNKKNTKIK